ncbi:MAG: PQQ-binding-like beta-propeller repeat protein [Planctomycetaceae bacterium]
MPRLLIRLLTIYLISGLTPAFAQEGDQQQAPQDASWPRWRGPRGDGTWNAPRLSDTWPESGLIRHWSTPVGGGYAGVTAVRGAVFVLDRETGPLDPKTSRPNPKNETERLHCLDAATGRTIWSHAWPQPYGDLNYGSGPRAAATVHEDFVFVLGALGQLRCVRFRDGTLIWKHDLVREFGGRPPTWGYAASPLVFGETVIVQTGSPDGFSLMAFALKTGRVIWHSLRDQAGYSCPVPIRRSAAKNTELVLWTPSHVRGLNADSGKPLWEIPYKVSEGVSIATPIIHNDIALVCGYWEGSRAIRLGTQPGEATLLWENRLLRGLMSQPLFRDGNVFLLDRRDGIVCFELQTGRKLWDDANALTPRGRDPQASFVWTGNADQILALNSEGELVLAQFAASGYREQARAKIIDPTWAHPAFVGNRVFARSDSQIVCIELPVANRCR